ncbi:MAG: riboflavin biosynthesis protein RibF [Oscillospiraceae bacterium]|nr:riboflavin biosynthesis protein RibF [Oscillospiraceae bacterium]
MHYFSEHDLPDRSTSVALGIFDGLHAGHMAVISAAVAADELLPVVFTFTFDHPSEAAKADFAPILTPSMKDRLLKEAGVRAVLAPKFSEVRSLSPEEFFQKILVKQLKAKRLCCGEDFRFGKGASGDCTLLKKLCAENDIELVCIPPMNMDGEPISATRIRAAVREGDMQAAEKLMGRPYAIDHEVVHGRHLGHDVFGFPTINQIFGEGELLPRFGVYETRITLGGESWKGVTNVGIKPSIAGGDRPSAETHIIGFDRDIYGTCPLTEFIRFVRGEQTFPSFEALKEQIRADVAAVAGR